MCIIIPAIITKATANVKFSCTSCKSCWGTRTNKDGKSCTKCNGSGKDNTVPVKKLKFCFWFCIFTFVIGGILLGNQVGSQYSIDGEATAGYIVGCVLTILPVVV